jgi:BirA family biotin operon repressor/biotin-[acetyl-CoA-carboxylase] ligase
MKELIAGGRWPEEERYLRAGYQTAGRGQTGNGWESEEGKNLLCSVLIDISHWPLAVRPFYLNVAVSVAVHRMISSQPSASSRQLTIKWPNDIYWGDKKVAGILVEGAIIGNEMQYAIAGIGLNVNQTEWRSDAPNPVSLKQITGGGDYDLDELMTRLMTELDKTLEEDVWDYYKAHLYRREGFWPFVEREVSTAPTMNASGGEPANDRFMAQIEDVLPTGELLLRDREGKSRRYHFKQVRYVV